MDLIRLLEEGARMVLIERQMPSSDLISKIVSKGLGYGIIAGSSLVKVPQLLNVQRSGSAEGLSYVGIETELVGYAVHTAYSIRGLALPFSAYGESVFLVIQSLALLLMVYSYGRVPLARRLAALLLLGGLAAGVFIALPEALLARLYELNTFVFLAARLPQVLENYRSKSTGQLSIVTCTLNLAGSLARIFTSYKEGASASMIRSYALSLMMHLTLINQIIYYGKQGPTAGKGAKVSAPAAERRRKKAE